MASRLRRSASASAAIFTNSSPRWLISITDMPASCQVTSSHLAFSRTSTGMAAGPAPKLKMRVAGLMWCSVAAVIVPVSVSAVPVPGPVFALFVVAVHDGLQARELLALAQVDERDTLRGAPPFPDLVHVRADEHAAGGDQH